jgi:hypothetical protein
MCNEKEAWALLRKESIDAMQLHGELKRNAELAAYAKYLKSKEKGFKDENINQRVLVRSGKFMWYSPWKTE